MNNAAAIHELNRAAAEFRARQDEAPTAHSAREIAQIDVLSEYLHRTHTRTLSGSLFGSMIDSYDPHSRRATSRCAPFLQLVLNCSIAGISRGDEFREPR
jgi:hypothetical protein